MKYLLIFLIIISCGKRTTSNQSLSIKSDSITIENNRVLKQEIILKDIYSIKPFDVLKPMIIDGKKYFNVSIIYDKSSFDNFEIKEESRFIEVNKSSIQKSKETDKSDNTILFLGLFFILCLFVFLWFKLK